MKTVRIKNFLTREIIEEFYNVVEVLPSEMESHILLKYQEGNFRLIPVKGVEIHVVEEDNQ